MHQKIKESRPKTNRESALSLPVPQAQATLAKKGWVVSKTFSYEKFIWLIITLIINVSLHTWPHNVRGDLEGPICLFHLIVAVSTHHKVAINAPTCAPRVFDEPIIFTITTLTLSVANDGDRVVNLVSIRVLQIATTVFGHDSTTLIVLHTFQVRVVCDTDLLVRKSLLKPLVWDEIFFIGKVIVEFWNWWSWLFTLLLLGCVLVLVVVPFDNAVIDRPIVSISHPPTIATIVCLVTV